MNLESLVGRAEPAMPSIVFLKVLRCRTQLNAAAFARDLRSNKRQLQLSHRIVIPDGIELRFPPSDLSQHGRPCNRSRTRRRCCISLHFSFQFPSFGDFFNDGFADAPVADTSDRISDSSYFHKWFPQVNERSACSRVSVHSTRLPAFRWL